MNQDFGVYLVTDAGLSADRSTVEIVESAIRGGVDVIQLREKGACARDRYELGTEIRELTHEANVPLIVNDRVDLAAAIDADGVHLGDDDLPVSAARAQLGETAIIGRSVSTPEAARRAEREGADYLGVGAVYGTTSKETDPEQSNIGLERIRAVREATDLPFVGIGGVTSENARAVIQAGANGVAVISAITGADDPEAATRRLSVAVREVNADA